MTPSISVIAPVYKTEKFLKTCLDSILAQTFSDWELIAVDDCSPDGSSKILDRFARRDPRIRVVTHPVNRGVSQARFTGLEHATGRYVVFVDSDDWMPRNALRALHDKIESTGADMVIGSMVKTFGPRSMIKTRPSNSISPQRLRAEPIVAPELMERYFLNFFGVNLLPSNMCGKIYRRSTLSGAPLAPVPFSLFEDMIFNMTLHPWLTKIGFVTDTVYCYRFGGGSSTSTPRFLSDVKAQYRLKESYIRQYDYRVATPYIKVELINCFYSHFANLALLDRVDYDTIGRLVADELTDDIYNKNLFDGIVPSEKSMALHNRDIPAIVATVRETVRRNRPRHRLKKLISHLIS